MAVDPGLKAALVKRLGVTQRHVARLISERATSLLLSRERAAMAIAAEAGIGLSRYATEEDLAVIRAAKSGAAAPAPTTTTERAEREVPRRRATKAQKTLAKKKASARPVRGKSKRKVFVVHGRDEARRRAMFAFLRSIGLTPVEWSKAIKDTGSATPYVGHVIDALFETTVAVVVVLTPDDPAHLKPEFVKPHDPDYERTPTGQARPNVLFEAGMAFGRRPDHTVLVQIGSLRPFSDIGGRHVIYMDNSAEKRTALANRLGSAGCEIDLDGTDWLTEGDFL